MNHDESVAKTDSAAAAGAGGPKSAVCSCELKNLLASV